MNKTQASIEDRLAALESIGTALSATSEARYNELANQIASLLQLISNIVEQQKLLKAKVDQIMSKSQSTDKNGSVILKWADVVERETTTKVFNKDSDLKQQDNSKNAEEQIKKEEQTNNDERGSGVKQRYKTESQVKNIEEQVKNNIEQDEDVTRQNITIESQNKMHKKQINDVGKIAVVKQQIKNKKEQIKTYEQLNNNVEQTKKDEQLINNIEKVEQLDNFAEQAKEFNQRHTNFESRSNKHEYANNLRQAKECKQQIKNTKEQIKKDQELNNDVKQAKEYSEQKKDFESPFKILEQEITNAETLTQENTGYINWNQTHKLLETHSYVSLRPLYDKIRIWKTYTTSPTVPKELSFQQKIYYAFGLSFKVDKTTQFPARGLYLNVNLPPIQFLLETVLDGKFSNQEEYHLEVDKLLDAIYTIMMNEKDGIHNRISFEERHKLRWVETTGVTS